MKPGKSELDRLVDKIEQALESSDPVSAVYGLIIREKNKAHQETKRMAEKLHE